MLGGLPLTILRCVKALFAAMEQGSTEAEVDG